MKSLKSFIGGLLFLCCLVWVPKAGAQGSNSWATGYPTPGTLQGSIDVKGTATPPNGFTLQKSGTVVVWPVAGGAQSTYAINVDPNTGNWDFQNNNWVAAELTGLTSGATYWVVCQVPAKMGVQTVTLLTPAAQCKAK